jgi:hypothetical protein
MKHALKHAGSEAVGSSSRQPGRSNLAKNVVLPPNRYYLFANAGPSVRIFMQHLPGNDEFEPELACEEGIDIRGHRVVLAHQQGRGDVRRDEDGGH